MIPSIEIQYNLLKLYVKLNAFACKIDVTRHLLNIIQANHLRSSQNN